MEGTHPGSAGSTLAGGSPVIGTLASTPAPGPSPAPAPGALASGPGPVPHPEPVADQLATAIGPAARQPDGNYQVSIRLHPEELGVVHVELHIDAGVVNVSVHADGDATRDLLRQNMGHLRQQLASSGLATGRFDVGGGSPQTTQGQGQQRAASPGVPPGAGLPGQPAALSAAEPLLPASTERALDMRL